MFYFFNIESTISVPGKLIGQKNEKVKKNGMKRGKKNLYIKEKDMKEKITLSIRKKVLDAVFSKIGNDEFDEIDEIFEDAILAYYNIGINEINNQSNTLILDDQGNYLLGRELNYVYVFLDPRFINRKKFDIDFDLPFEPFYIGRGKCNRIDNQERNYIVEQRISEIQNSGNAVVKIKMFENLSRYDSFIIENNIINKIGRRDQGNGPLLNLSGGKSLKQNEMNYSPINIENQINGLILDTLNSTGKINKTAKKLGLSVRTLYRKMKALGIIKKDKKFIIA